MALKSVLLQLVEEAAQIQKPCHGEAEGETPPDAGGAAVHDDAEEVTEGDGHDTVAEEGVFHQFLHVAYASEGIDVARLHAVAHLIEYHGPNHGHHGGGDGGKQCRVVVGHEDAGYLPAEDEYQRRSDYAYDYHQMISGMGGKAYAPPSANAMVVRHADGYGRAYTNIEHIYERGHLASHLMCGQGRGGIPRYASAPQGKGHTREGSQFHGQLQGNGPAEAVMPEERTACHHGRLPQGAVYGVPLVQHEACEVEYEHQYPAGHRGPCRTCDTHFRKAEVAEDEQPVTHYIPYVSCQHYPHGGACVREAIVEALHARTDVHYQKRGYEYEHVLADERQKSRVHPHQGQGGITGIHEQAHEDALKDVGKERGLQFADYVLMLALAVEFAYGGHGRHAEAHAQELCHYEEGVGKACRRQFRGRMLAEHQRVGHALQGEPHLRHRDGKSQF